MFEKEANYVSALKHTLSNAQSASTYDVILRAQGQHLP